MNRREFTASLAALTTAPTLKVAAATTTAVPIASQQFATAKLIARAHNSCSPQMLARLMQLDQATAHGLQNLLFEKGVVTHANGLAMATNPMNTNCIPIDAMKPTNLTQSVMDVRKKVRTLTQKAESLVQNTPETVQNPRAVDLHCDSDEQVDRDSKRESDAG